MVRKICGIVPVVLTPLTKKKDIDVEGLHRLISFLHTKRVGGLWVLGTGSEDMNLSFDKRFHVAQVACAANDGKLPLILGSGFFATEEIIRFMGMTSGLKFDAYHVMPYNPKMSLNNLYDFYTRIAYYSTRPIWLYASGNWSIPIPADFIKRMKEHPSGKFAGIKFSNTNTKNLQEVLNLADSEFQVITAVASQLYTCICLRSAAHTSSLASCLPEPMVDIYEWAISGMTTMALEKQRRLNTFLVELAKNTKKDNFLQAADEKYILKLRGICDIFMTDGYREINEEEKKRLEYLLERFKFYDY